MGSREASVGNQRRSADASGLTTRLEGAALMLVLDRPTRRNAIDRAMRQRLAATLASHGRDPQVYAAVLKSTLEGVFSVGGDVRELLAEQEREPASAADWLREECELIWLANCFPRPTVALIDGPVMGTAAGLALVATHQAAGERYQLQMPETAIGFFPDVGMARAFAHMPDMVGVFLGLTGHAIGRADAFHLGLASHCIARSRFGEIEAALADAQPIDPLLDERHEDPGPAPIEQLRGVISSCFSAGSVVEILDRLAQSQVERSWCAATRGQLMRRSPLALEVTLRHIRQAGELDLRQTLMADYRIGCRLAAGHDFRTGVRAVLIDKSGAPRWHPSALADVSAAMIEDVMKPVNGGGLSLPTKQEVEAGVDWP